MYHSELVVSKEKKCSQASIIDANGDTKTKNSCIKSNQQRLSKPQINNGFDLIYNQIFSQNSHKPDYLHWVWNSQCYKEVLQVPFMHLRDGSFHSHSAAEAGGCVCWNRERWRMPTGQKDLFVF